MKPQELERTYAPGQLIIERGAQQRELFVVRSGTVLLDSVDGCEPRLVGPGQVFGEAGAVLAGTSPYRAEADDEVTVLAIDPATVTRLCSENGEFAVRLVKHLAAELSTANDERGALGGIDLRLSQGYKKLVPVLFERAGTREPPAAVPGNLGELSEQAELTTLDAYFCIQRLLETRVVRLIDDQLVIVEPDQLELLIR
jgi:CRP-like cAMP-binding protein